jgi:glycosyltransferase involved in cell wall biosynthesis
MTNLPRVRVVPVQPHCFHFGGFDLQMYRTQELLKNNGFDVKPLDFWSKDNEWELLHVWGLEKSHQQVIELAKIHGKKIILTALLPYITWPKWFEHYFSLVAGGRRILMNIVSNIDLMLVHNEQQVESAHRIFNLPLNKIDIIPSILDPFFFNPTIPPKFVDLEKYFICVGNIWPRKNQVRLAKAAKLIGCPLVFIGNVMGGELSYANEFLELVNSSPNIRWYKWISFEEIKSAYFYSEGVALPSFNETQPGCAFEGAALGKPVLIGNKPYAYQKYFSNACVVDCSSVEAIAEGLNQLMTRPKSYVTDQLIMKTCQPDIIGLKLTEIFKSI